MGVGVLLGEDAGEGAVIVVLGVGVWACEAELCLARPLEVVEREGVGNGVLGFFGFGGRLDEGEGEPDR